MNIEAKNLSKIYGDGENRVVALDHANLEIVSSDFISIMGPSGSGKSTLLHLLSGLDKPSSGSLTYDGKDIYSYSDKELSAFRRKRIGFIFQQFNLLPVLTAKENIIMPLLLDKQNPDEAYLKQLTELLGIQGRLEHLPHELSGGQQQRVAIARALIAKPDVIFADEPTGNLDSKSGGEVMELLQNVWKKMGKALVVITHDSRIARMADRQFQIVDGEQQLICDMEWTGEAIGNIVKNALDHTQAGGIVRITWERTPAMFRIFISDNGNGIVPEDIYHIFKRFYRSKHSLDTQGIGLGLPLAKSIIEGQNGVISVQSEVGKGTLFTLSFLTDL